MASATNLKPAPAWQTAFSFVQIVVVPPRVRARRADCKSPHPIVEQLPLRPRPAAPALPGPIRPPALRAYAPRKMMAGARPRSMGVDGLSESERQELRRDEADLVSLGIYARHADGTVGWGRLAPKTVADCPEGPCGFVSCAYHLKLEVDPVSGIVKDMWPGREVWEMPETCVLRVAAMPSEDDLPGEENLSLMTVGAYLNVTLESARLTEFSAIRKLRESGDVRRDLNEDEDDE